MFFSADAGDVDEEKYLSFPFLSCTGLALVREIKAFIGSH